MLAVIKEADVCQIVKENSNDFQIVTMGNVPNTWSQYRDIFRDFLESQHDQLIVISDLDRIELDEISSLNSFKFFDCFDVTTYRKTPSVFIRRIKHIARFWIPANLLISINIRLGNKFLTRLIATNARARAISYLAKEISTEKNVRTNWISENPAGIIFSRKAAEILIEFNIRDLISVDRVLFSVLRSSNLAFGSFL